MSKYVGLDPSFSHFGISYIDSDKKELVFDEKQYELFLKSHKNKFETIWFIAKETLIYIENLKEIAKTYVGQEISTVYNAMYVGELYGLACNIYNKLCVAGLAGYNIYSQSYLTFILGRNIPKKDKKEYTIFYIENNILPIFMHHGYTITKRIVTQTKTGEKNGRFNVKRETITDGSADAFIYALREFIANSTDIDLVNDILNLNPKFKEVKSLD